MFRDWRDIEDIFKDLERMLKSMEDRYTKEWHWGWTFTIGPDGIPRFRQFGNPPSRRDIIEDKVRQPYYDVIEENDDIDITIELPGISKKDISIELLDNNTKLYVSAKNEEREYKATIYLPQRVKDEPKRSTFKNGILNIIFEKDRSKAKSININ